jgi:DNA-directed RNA polymerase subunit alpha
MNNLNYPFYSVEKSDNFRGVFFLHPIEKGYGTIAGKAFRKILLSSLEGYAITGIKIPGVEHEFSLIEGVEENVPEIILGLRQVQIKKADNANDTTVQIKIEKQKQFTAGDIARFATDIEILNPDFVICHLSESTSFEITISFEKGRGYLPYEENELKQKAIGYLAVDSFFTPVLNANYCLVNEGQDAEHDKLRIEIETKGSIHPEKAMDEAVAIWIRHGRLLSGNEGMPDIRQLMRTEFSWIFQ